MNRLILLLGITTTAFAASSVWLWREMHLNRERAELLHARVQELEVARSMRSPFDAHSRIAASTPQPPADRVAAALTQQPATVVAAPVDVTTSPRFDRQAALERQRQLMRDPAYREAMKSQQKMMLLRTYPDLAKELNFSPEEADRLLDLLAGQQLRAQTMQPPPPLSGGTRDENEIRAWQEQMVQVRRDQEAEIASLLGAAKLQEWQDYQKTLGARQQVRELRTVLDGASTPLRDDQARSLVTAIAAEQERHQSEMRTAMQSVQRRDPSKSMTAAERMTWQEENLQRIERYNERLHAAAVPYLSGDQLRRYDQMLDQQVEMQRAQLQMMRVRLEAEERGEIQDPTQGMVGTAIAVPAL